ncbi:hypothetical protein [Lysinibacillus sp. G4S2]|uniref:hypothetical protein n=1 Tax=Lysinibacillus sp. G4S2 TaxID=3055859 RepID=UPI0025A137E6|nr:hypothetical protein [Lysinibacillus sp. G4S2]MDM5246479.1 hypothetical protein [Lysinibacillus sp. G4S2]
MGISVIDEILERASRVKRLIGRPQGALLCAKAKRQRQMFYLCESEATATTKVFCSDSYKAPGRNGNQSHVLVMSHKNGEILWVTNLVKSVTI